MAVRDTDWKAAKISGLFYPTRDAFIRGTTIVVFGVGGWWALFGPPFGLTAPLSAGEFVSFYLYAQMFVSRTSLVGDIVDDYADYRASAKRVLGLIHHSATIEDANDDAMLEDMSGAVGFKEVTFQYPNADEPSLRGVDFHVEPGAFVGLVGPTGAGKTTILKLLVRFYDPDEGRICVDGTDTHEVTLTSLRQAIGYVAQEPFLFDATVQENIAYGDPEADEAAIIEAAEIANAHEFITNLPDGYDTKIGERGVKLSGGQRRRIAIARVVLTDPAILLLDEATSHVDNRTELLIKESLDEIIADRTTFAIAHQLSTVRNADQLLVLQDGVLVERGTHEDLVDDGGLYETLWRIHLGETDVVPEIVHEGESPN